MARIEFMATFGDERKQVELSQPNGGSGGYHFMVGKFYWGSFVPRPGGHWEYTGDKLDLDDIQILTDLIYANES